jgi:aminoglycoside phosphotransferase (APT) family kinase protein
LRTRLEQISDLSWVDPERAIAVWERALAAPVFEEERVWVHGDLHPQNILVADGLVSAVVDFGDLNGGDPATDIAIAWMMFDAGDRARLRAGHGRVDDATWERGRGWALHLGVSFVAASADNPTMGGIGKTAVERVLADREAEQKP